jgi:hypothetical protein
VEVLSEVDVVKPIFTSIRSFNPNFSGSPFGRLKEIIVTAIIIAVKLVFFAAFLLGVVFLFIVFSLLGG